MQLLVKADGILLSFTVLQDNTRQETSTDSYKICCESLPNQAFVFLLKDKGVQNLLLSQTVAVATEVATETNPYILECKMSLKRNIHLLKNLVIQNKYLKFTVL